MTITSTLTQSNVALNQAYGGWLDSAAQPAAAAITVGFKPRYVRVFNSTDLITYEWMDEFADTYTLKTAQNGDRTMDSGTIITVADTTAQQTAPYTAAGFLPARQKGTFVVTIKGYTGTGPVLQNKQVYYEIME